MRRLVFDNDHRFRNFNFNPRPVGRPKRCWVDETYNIALSIWGSEENIAHTFHHGIEFLDNWHQLINQHFAFDTIDGLFILSLSCLALGFSAIDNTFCSSSFLSILFYSSRFCFGTIDNTSLVFFVFATLSPLLIRQLYFRLRASTKTSLPFWTTTSSHAAARYERLGSICLRFPVSIVCPGAVCCKT